MSKYEIPFWKEAPFVRLLIPFICGVVFSYYSMLSQEVCLWVSGFFLLPIITFERVNLRLRYKFKRINGAMLHAFVGAFGAFAGSRSNPYQGLKLLRPYCVGSSSETLFIASLMEPPLEKKLTWKVLAKFDAIKISDSIIRPHSYLHIYFEKDSVQMVPHYGSRISFRKKPERIKNFAAGSRFDYQEYCALKNIHYQVFLRPGEFTYLDGDNSRSLNEFIFSTQKWVTGVLKQYITPATECGLAEALLIGYRNDLDRNLVQSYSNTGVVHVVAISGLHLGLIYAMLNFFCRLFNRFKLKAAISPVIILTGLWLFSLLAGASPSVLRSAVMFSFIVLGKAGSRQSSLLNNLAASAFFLLCYEPYWLWDLGFILSYSALLSITIFLDLIYYSFIPKNKLIAMVWKVSAVTIAAQILTMPVLIYYFGQFPNLFLLTNFVAIPLSGVILCALITLCVVAGWPAAATIAGQVASVLINWMNAFVSYIDGISFSSTKDITITFLQLILLYAFIAFAANWLIREHKNSIYGALISLIVFFLVVLQPFKGTS